MAELFRVYFDPDDIGIDGYPFAWHRGEGLMQDYDEQGECAGVREAQAIKDLIRERDGNRCLRCGHPYRKGEHGDGQWSVCDEQCSHAGPLGLVEPQIIEHWREHGGPLIPLAVENRDVRRTPAELRELESVAGRGLLVCAQWRILTVHHLNGIKYDCRWWNLVSLCQRDHLTIQGKVYMDRPWEKPHSEWFRPFAAGFYAWKYLGLELTQEETMARLDELLALEHTQEALF